MSEANRIMHDAYMHQTEMRELVASMPTLSDEQRRRLWTEIESYTKARK